MMREAHTGEGEQTLSVEGTTVLEIPLASPPDWVAAAIGRQSVGFECASGDWIEREYEAFPVSTILDAAEFPAETTHVQLESSDGYRACVPVLGLSDAVVAVGDGDGRPQFVSPTVVGPRAIKNLTAIRPLSLDPGEDREEYERLPID